jgi:hypothetical protein
MSSVAGGADGQLRVFSSDPGERGERVLRNGVALPSSAAAAPNFVAAARGNDGACGCRWRVGCSRRQIGRP